MYPWYVSPVFMRKRTYRARLLRNGDTYLRYMSP